jgi:cell division septation protein DedD
MTNRLGRRAMPWAALCVAAACIARPSASMAQTEPRLVRAVRLAQEGLGDSARAMVKRVADATPPTDTLYPQVLYTGAVVAATPQEMRRDLQRVTAEYAASTWADRALLRLAQLDFATNDRESAVRNLERLRLDYPTSPVYAQAAFWAGRIYFDLQRPPSACRWLAEGLARAGSDVELKNQMTFYNQRCVGVALDTTRVDSARVDSTTRVAAGPAADSARPTDVPAPASPPTDTTRHTAAAAEAPTARAPKPDSAPAKPAQAVFRIQVAAVNARPAAEDIAKRLRTSGLDPVVVAEKGLYKVRVGAYPTRAAAVAALPGIRAKVGGQPFVVAP